MVQKKKMVRKLFSTWEKILQFEACKSEKQSCVIFLLYLMKEWTNLANFCWFSTSSLKFCKIFDSITRIFLSHSSRSEQWYFVTKIVLTNCEKKLFWWSRKRNSGWRQIICKLFEITRTIDSNRERSEHFMVTECLFYLFLEVSHI